MPAGAAKVIGGDESDGVVAGGIDLAADGCIHVGSDGVHELAGEHAVGVKAKLTACGKLGGDFVVPLTNPEGFDAIVGALLEVATAGFVHDGVQRSNAANAEGILFGNGGADDRSDVPEAFAVGGVGVIHKHGGGAGLVFEGFEVAREGADRGVVLGIVFAELDVTAELQTECDVLRRGIERDAPIESHGADPGGVFANRFLKSTAGLEEQVVENAGGSSFFGRERQSERADERRAKKQPCSTH